VVFPTAFGDSSDLELDSFGIAAIEMGLHFKLIKNRRFQAEMVVETEQKLADGSSLHKKKTEVFYRYQKGRLREEPVGPPDAEHP
jgi:hypothetical protein